MSSLDDVTRRIREVLVRSLSLDLAEEGVRYAEKLDELAGVDSLAMLEFVTALEKEFGLTFDAELLELETLKDFRALAAYIESRLAGPGGAPDGG